jgi:hypothetical protein
VAFVARATATDITRMIPLHYAAMTALTTWMVLLAGFMIYVLIAG